MDTAVKRQGCIYCVFRNKPLTLEAFYVELRLIYPDKLDCGIPAADGLDNSLRIYKT